MFLHLSGITLKLLVHAPPTASCWAPGCIGDAPGAKTLWWMTLSLSEPTHCTFLSYASGILSTAVLVTALAIGSVLVVPVG